MRKGLIVGVLACAVSLSGAASWVLLRYRDADTGETSRQKLSDKSPYAGSVVEHPDDLAGLWEVQDGNGGAVGISLGLHTTVPASVSSLAGVTQAWEGLTVGVYRRAGRNREFGDTNYFSDAERGGSVRYEDGRLLLHGNDFDLDLRRANGDVWVGRLHRRQIDRQVTLRRPRMTGRTGTEWFAGTWLKGDRRFPLPQCVHVGLTEDGGLVGWSDALELLGGVRYSPRVGKPAKAFEQYGAAISVERRGSDQVAVHWEGPNSQDVIFRRAGTSGIQIDTGSERQLWHKITGQSCSSHGGR